jgi:hypothetical protein
MKQPTLSSGTGKESPNATGVDIAPHSFSGPQVFGGAVEKNVGSGHLPFFPVAKPAMVRHSLPDAFEVNGGTPMAAADLCDGPR